MKKRSLKQIVNYKNCLAIIFNDIGCKGYKLQPINDMGFYFEIMGLDSSDVDIYEISKLYINKKQWFCVVTTDLEESEIDNPILDNLIREYLKGEF